MFFGNTLYLVALGYYTIICFLGYNGKLILASPLNQKSRVANSYHQLCHSSTTQSSSSPLASCMLLFGSPASSAST